MSSKEKAAQVHDRVSKEAAHSASRTEPTASHVTARAVLAKFASYYKP